MMAELAEMDGPADEEWYMVGISGPESDELVGDLALHLSRKGRSAEVGYTLASAHWGNGYAAEAVAALVEYLFEDLGVTRVSAMLHPDNVGSAQVVERTGFLFEGHTRLSYWVGDEPSDEYIYGMVREDWEAWTTRPSDVATIVCLVEINTTNRRSVGQLCTHKSQERFVAPIPVSFADALFPEAADGATVVPWMAAIEADGELAGFVMLALTSEHQLEPYFWRLLVDRLHQRRGIGAAVLDLIEAECRALGDKTLVTSWAHGRGSPGPFYLSHGFEPTGRVVEGEIEARRRFPEVG